MSLLPLRRLAAPAVAVVASLVATPLARARTEWVRPVPGPVVARFAYARGTPFAAGQRRGVELAAAPGELVLAPCAGTAAYAGRVPRYGAGVTVRCGALSATLLGLSALAVRRRQPVAAGELLGTAGSRGRVHLGARWTRDPFGYRDPLALLGPPPRSGPRLVIRPRRSSPAEPLGPAPAPVSAREPARIPAPRPVTAPRPVLRPAPSRPVTVPAAWLGLALLAVAVPAGGLVRRRRRRAAHVLDRAHQTTV